MQKIMLFLLFSLAACSQESAVIENGNSKIAYRKFGSGSPLLIINGGPGMNSEGFVPLAKKLAENNTVFIFDQRGTGKSTLEHVNQNTITVDLMISDIEALRTHLKLDKWIVLGHSFGGMLASYYATIHPQRISKLILSSSGGIDLNLQTYVGSRIDNLLTKQQRDSLNYWNQKISNGDTTFRARIGRGRALAPAYVYDQSHAKTIAQRLTEGSSQINSLVWQDLQRIKFNCKSKLATFESPVLIIAGRNDILDIETAERAHKAFKNATLMLLDNCGHYGWLDREVAYFSAIHNFLTTE